MKKIHRAVQTGPNKWEKKSSLNLSTSDKIGLGIVAVTIAYIVLHIVIG